MRAGNFNQNIEILRKEVVTNDYGIDKESWNTVIRTRAKVDYVTGDRTEENREIFFT